MFYQYLINIEEIDDEVAELALHNYVFKDLNNNKVILTKKLSLTSSNNEEEILNNKINKKAKRIIYYSLRTTKFLLKYAVKTILNYVLPPIAKEFSKIGINELIKLIEKYLNQEKFDDIKQEKDEFLNKLSNDAKDLFEKMLIHCKKICKKQNRQLKEDLNDMVIKQKEKEKIKNLKEKNKELKEIINYKN